MNELDEIREKKKRELLNKAGRARVKRKIEVNDSNFEKEVLERSREIPVVVDFYADWCMPCRIICPTLEKIALDYNGKFVLAKLNTQYCPRTSMAYRISSIPAVKLFKNGMIVDEFVGVLPEPRIKSWLEKNLS